MKKYLTPLYIIFALEVVVVILAATGLVPREVILVWTGLAIFYMVFSPVSDSLWLVVASIPLFAALPITDNFDTMANWRLLIAVLFLVWLVKELKKYCSSESRTGGTSRELYYLTSRLATLARRIKTLPFLNTLTVIFLLIAAFSIGVADYRILAFKKLLFLINIFLLFVVVRNKTRNKENILRVWQAAAAGAVMAIVVALGQLVSVWFVPLIYFWQFWAGRVIDFFYGQNLATLLAYANTWFSYYNSAPPTLRLFSVFPDSHSFAMFSLLAVPIFLCLGLFYQPKRRFFWLLAGGALFGAVFSGSRGVWISALPVAALALYFWLKGTDKKIPKQAVLSLAVFALIFLASAAYPVLFYRIQAWQTGQYSSSTISFFERARSISDLDEVSNKGRLEIWRNSLSSIVQHPMLGAGLGNFVTVIGQDVDAVKKGASAHNLYLDITAEIGVPGLLILLLMFADILRTSWLVWRQAAESHFKLFGLLFGLYFVWILGYSFFDVVLFNDKVLLFFMVGLATLYSLRNIIFNPEKI